MSNLISEGASQTSGVERVPVVIRDQAQEIIASIAEEIGQAVKQSETADKPLVLGLATGSTPVPLYRELIRRHREEGLSFKNVVTFNLDEYYPLSPDHPESYHRFMRDQLFDHIDIPKDQINIPSGTAKREEVHEACRAYEEKIASYGGLDIQILGIGRTGHIGFNEPGSGPRSKTRLVTLDRLTKVDAARDFHGEHNVPRYAVTMGVGTIMAAKRVILMAWGRSKATVLRDAIEAEPVESLPASFLQAHDNVCFFLDQAAASELTRFRQPWLVGFPEWDNKLARQAVTELSLKIGKPLLKLLDKDYQENGLSELITEQGPAYDLNIRVFNEVQHTITGWPGGKPNADDTHRPERAVPAKKRVLVLSPEPQDDVLAMGGTLSRLAQGGHEITVAYLTSGSLGVPDEEARWAAELMIEAEEGIGSKLAKQVLAELKTKGESDNDSVQLRQFKGYIRRNEARSSLQACGVPSKCVTFLDLPFYEEGRYRRFKAGDTDRDLLLKLLNEVQPHQIFVTGEAGDPSSVQGISFSVFSEAYNQARQNVWVSDCYVWLYRSDGREWESHQIEMAVPCSPDELRTKAQAIYLHRSQRSQVPILDEEKTEVWELALERNRTTANNYDKLGLAEYEAIECFVRWS
ncbi:glucosamine-6-phosphate deaminase [Pelagicoccus albus]|uniref:Glucosamine-6-phosphate deaminase n=2 Tax=Pelagicoccus albus TaxID=415222 RepID=A0A7X1E9S7_9BACT|nr:glucosamine-6-phosphate deaminase [Pelagicoccus albus]